MIELSAPIEEINFRKRINKINILRRMLREKKELFSKLKGVPEAKEDCFKLQNDIAELETKINDLNNLQ